MGYEVRRTIRLDFDDPEGGDGLFVRLHSMTVGELNAFDGGGSEVEKLFADRLIEWNAEFGGELLPCSLEGVHQLDPPLRDMLVKEWLKAVRGVPHPLVLRSDAGQPSEPPQMTMADL